MSAKLLNNYLHNLRAFITYDEDDDRLTVTIKDTTRFSNDEMIPLVSLTFGDFGSVERGDIVLRFSMYNELGRTKDIASITIPYYPGNYGFDSVVLPLIFRSSARLSQLSPINPHFMEVKHYQGKFTHYVWKDAHNANNFLRLIITGNWVRDKPYPMTNNTPEENLGAICATYLDKRSG